MQIFVHEFYELNENRLVVPECAKVTDLRLVQNYPKGSKKTLNKTAPPEGRVVEFILPQGSNIKPLLVNQAQNIFVSYARTRNIDHPESSTRYDV